MKALMLLGALVGFLIGSGFGIASHSPWSETLWRSCAAALAGAVLTRWWSGIWFSSLVHAINQPRRPQPAAPVTPKTAGKTNV